MKLFAVACLASTGSAQSGDYEERGVSSDYYTAYGDYDDYGNKKKKNKYEENWFGDGKYDLDTRATTELDWATALNCWPANIDADSLVFNNQSPETGTMGLNPAKNAKTATTHPAQEFHARAPQHVYGSWEISGRANDAPADSREGDTGNAARNVIFNAKTEFDLHQEDPVQRSGLGGLYQYGHDTWDDAAHNENLEGTTANGATRWTHYKQARHAGCLYERGNWHYGYDTFDTIFLANYYQGYGQYDRSTAGMWISAYESDDTNGAGNVQPIWWHFFNAHVLPNPDHGNACSTTRCAFPTYPVTAVRPDEASFIQPAVQNSIPLVMANPAYEGLGYLNFVVEYKNKDKYVGGDYLEFIDSTPALYTHERYNDGATSTACSSANLSQCSYKEMATYREINKCSGDGIGGATRNPQECSGWGQHANSWNGVHGMYYYDLYMGSWLITPARSTAQDRDRKWTIYPLRAGDLSMQEWGRDDGDAAVTSLSMNLFDKDKLNAGTGTAYAVTGNDVEWYNAANPENRHWSASHDLVVSSFPHNNLGKDFRFNLRLIMGTIMQQPTPNDFGSTTRADYAALNGCGWTVNGSTGEFTGGTTACDITTGFAPNTREFDTLVRDYNDSYFYSYYFYKINEIEIKFPYHVAYALYHENRDVGTTSTEGRSTITATDTGDWWNTMNNVKNSDIGVGGHDGTDADAYSKNHAAGTFDNQNTASTVQEAKDTNFMHVGAAAVNKNIIPPVDLGTHAPNGGEFHRIHGYLSVGSTENPIKNAAEWCDADQRNHGDVELERVCGHTFNIVGLMNTYDERRGQRGTYQEVWVHLQYAIGKGGRDSSGVDATDAAQLCGTADVSTDTRCDALEDTVMQSPWPYLHFMASEILEINASCSTLNVNNPNTCRDIVFGPGRATDAAYGGK